MKTEIRIYFQTLTRTQAADVRPFRQLCDGEYSVLYRIRSITWLPVPSGHNQRNFAYTSIKCIVFHFQVRSVAKCRKSQLRYIILIDRDQYEISDWRYSLLQALLHCTQPQSAYSRVPPIVPTPSTTVTTPIRPIITVLPRISKTLRPYRAVPLHLQVGP